MKHSISRRLVSLFSITTLTVIVLISTALYTLLIVQLEGYQRRQLSSALHDRAYQIERIDHVDGWQRVSRKMGVLTPTDGGMRFWVLSDAPQFRFGGDLSFMARQSLGDMQMRELRLPGSDYTLSVLAQHFDANRERPAVTLVVGIDTRPYTEARRVFLLALVLLSLAAAATVYVLGKCVVRLGLQPLRQLSGQARQLSPANLAQRLELEPLPRELAGVTSAFNGALARLEHAYHQLDAFNADVAHELRTPLSNLIGQTQVALAKPRSADELADILHSNLEELGRLRSIVNDMLFLAHADRGEARPALAEANIADEINKAVEFLEPALDEAGKEVIVTGDLGACARLDGALLRRAFVNLLDNAIQYSSPQARIEVSIRSAAEHVTVAVINPGAAITAEHLPRLFDRFYRADPARHGGAHKRGYGLGLAIVKAIAQIHHGTVFAQSAAGRNSIGFSVAIL
ncbi:heavy metal sensor histidine kinase [Duganella sp. FT80W]|uniref:Sensor protein n=1 Tax=Duganella guangzhouensis TaxID=2666084 RepID=A0A6I2KWG5_9BURK|nr:heavy metal sensor histidine kinase [Duganella guangzhouensis]MRW89890.1 heavy metal sensor histidine kinase [Duganella guangzhouensis]